MSRTPSQVASPSEGHRDSASNERAEGNDGAEKSEGLPKGDQRPEPTLKQPRVQAAARSLRVLLAALECGNPNESALRVLDLEEQLADQRELTRRWREAYNGAKLLIADMAGKENEQRAEVFDAAVRRWVGR